MGTTYQSQLSLRAAIFDHDSVLCLLRWDSIQHGMHGLHEHQHVSGIQGPATHMPAPVLGSCLLNYDCAVQVSHPHSLTLHGSRTGVWGQRWSGILLTDYLKDPSTAVQVAIQGSLPCGTH